MAKHHRSFLPSLKRPLLLPIVTGEKVNVKKSLSYGCTLKPEAALSTIGSLLDDSASETWFVDVLNSTMGIGIDGLPCSGSVVTMAQNLMFGAKYLMLLVAPLQVVTNIALSVIGKTKSYIQNWAFWTRVFLLVDVLCCIISILIVWYEKLEGASKVFDEMIEKSVAGWSSIMAGHSRLLTETAYEVDLASALVCSEQHSIAIKEMAFFEIESELSYHTSKVLDELSNRKHVFGIAMAAGDKYYTARQLLRTMVLGAYTLQRVLTEYEIALLCLLQLLIHTHNKSITKEACWTILNITARNIQVVNVAGIIALLVSLLQTGETDIKKEAGCFFWCLGSDYLVVCSGWRLGRSQFVLLRGI